MTGYRLKKEGTHVFGNVWCMRTGAALVPDANGNFGDSPAFSMPEGWRNGSGTPQFITIHQSGVKSAFARENGNIATGMVAVTHGIPGATVSGDFNWYFPLDYHTS